LAAAVTGDAGSARLFDVGGHRLHLACEGTGSPAVVFDAALGASSLSWSLVQPSVARATRACAYDRAGFGWSDGGPLPRTAGVMARELHDLLRAAGVPPPYVLAGHSFGALVVRIVAARHPADVAGLILIDPADPEEWLDPGERQRQEIARGVRLCRYGARAARIGVARVVARLVGLGALAPARALVALVSRGGLRRADEEILAPIWKLPPEARRPLRRFWTQPKFFEALGSQIETICTSARDVREAEVASSIPVPVTVISASATAPRRRELHEAFAGRSARGRHTTAHASGHWIPLDEPATVIDAVLDMVETIRRNSYDPARREGPPR
jgi:pimeloyl-ACP methyl ester carboxylesterase